MHCNNVSEPCGQTSLLPMRNPVPHQPEVQVCIVFDALGDMEFA
ncbi:MAG: hypothetical protein ACI9BK_003116, partial [Acidimicrobiales bacterium]